MTKPLVKKGVLHIKKAAYVKRKLLLTHRDLLTTLDKARLKIVFHRRIEILKPA